MTLAFLAIAIFHFIVSAIKKKAKGEKYLFPWQTKGDSAFGEVVMTDKTLLFWIAIGGALEYLGAQSSTIAFNATLSAGMNGGIVGALIALNTVFVMIAAYFMFGESFSSIKFISILALLCSVILVTLFPPESITSQNDMLVQSAVGGVNTQISDSSIIPLLTGDELF